MKCKVCGDEFSKDDLKELKEIGEQYYLKHDSFYCPDCWDNFNRQDLENQFETLMKDGEEIV